MAQTISRQALSGEELDVVWNLTLAANLISADVAMETSKPSRQYLG